MPGRAPGPDGEQSATATTKLVTFPARSKSAPAKTYAAAPSPAGDKERLVTLLVGAGANTKFTVIRKILGVPRLPRHGRHGVYAGLPISARDRSAGFSIRRNSDARQQSKLPVAKAVKKEAAHLPETGKSGVCRQRDAIARRE
jgi:hypothetical protein